jgi:aldehyde dehydrogenase (NAD+)
VRIAECVVHRRGFQESRGGRRPANLPRGFYFEPTLFEEEDPGSVIAQEEIFGPVGVVIGYDSDDEAVELANRSLFGLRGGIISADVASSARVTAESWARRD